MHVDERRRQRVRGDDPRMTSHGSASPRGGQEDQSLVINFIKRPASLEKFAGHCRLRLNERRIAANPLIRQASRQGLGSSGGLIAHQPVDYRHSQLESARSR